MNFQIEKIYPFHSKKFKTSEGYSLNYVDESPEVESTETFLMLHGNPTWSFFYREPIKHFSKTSRVVALDHLGHGLSDKPLNAKYELETRIRHVEELVQACELKNITLVVHDWGGAIGMGFATRHPELIKRLVFLNTAAFTSDYIPLPIFLGKTGFGQWLIERKNAFVKSANYVTTVQPLSKDVRAAYLYPYANDASCISTAEFVKDIPMHSGHKSYATLKTIENKLTLFENTPKKFIWAKDDWCFNDKFLHVWKSIYPNAEFEVVEEAGHYILEDQPEFVIRSIESFIK